MELEIASKEIIKPLSSTPPELKNLPFSWFDQRTPNVYTKLHYFYNNNVGSGRGGGGHDLMLKHSLSKALTFYYPFAGRLGDDGNSIDCNDMGATFLEARLRHPMSEVMSAFDLQRDEVLKLLSYDDMNGKSPRSFDPLLSVQLTQFECGGELIYVCLAHKVADLATFTNFMNDWASIARGDSGGGGVLPTVCPRFDSARLFRPELDVSGGGDKSGEEGSRNEKGEEKNVSSKRLVFEGSRIEALKAMVCEKVENPSRVQILTAFIYRALLAAKISVSSGRPATSLFQLINLRSRLEPPLPATLAGNIISFFTASTTTPEQTTEIELWSLVADVKRNFEEFCKKFPKNYREKEWDSLHKLFVKESMERWINPGRDHTVYTCTSWCRFPLYDADFGWGKPIWIIALDFLVKNMILLMDKKDGEGIEVLLSLEKEEMEAFEQNEELLSFCKLRS